MVLKVLIKKKKYFRRRKKLIQQKKVLTQMNIKKSLRIKKKSFRSTKEEMNLYNQSPKIGALPEKFYWKSNPIIKEYMKEKNIRVVIEKKSYLLMNN